MHSYQGIFSFYVTFVLSNTPILAENRGFSERLSSEKPLFSAFLSCRSCIKSYVYFSDGLLVISRYPSGFTRVTNKSLQYPPVHGIIELSIQSNISKGRRALHMEEKNKHGQYVNPGNQGVLSLSIQYFFLF